MPVDCLLLVTDRSITDQQIKQLGDKEQPTRLTTKYQRFKLLLSVISYCSRQLLMIWNQNKHTCQIDKIKKTNPFIDTSTGFIWRISQERKKNIVIRFKMRNVEIFSPFEELMAPLIIFNVIIRGTFMYFAMQNPRRLLILDWY